MNKEVYEILSDIRAYFEGISGIAKEYENDIKEILEKYGE